MEIKIQEVDKMILTPTRDNIYIYKGKKRSYLRLPQGHHQWDEQFLP